MREAEMTEGHGTRNVVTLDDDGEWWYQTSRYDREMDMNVGGPPQRLYLDSAGNAFYDDGLLNPASNEGQSLVDKLRAE